MRTAKRNQAQWDAFEASLISREPVAQTQARYERVLVWFVGIPVLFIVYAIVMWRWVL